MTESLHPRFGVVNTLFPIINDDCSAHVLASFFLSLLGRRFILPALFNEPLLLAASISDGLSHKRGPVARERRRHYLQPGILKTGLAKHPNVPVQSRRWLLKDVSWTFSTDGMHHERFP